MEQNKNILKISELGAIEIALKLSKVIVGLASASAASIQFLFLNTIFGGKQLSSGYYLTETIIRN